MEIVNHNQAKEHLKKCYAVKEPCFLWGTFGIGKSAIVKEVTDDLGISLIDIRLTQLEPSDLRGLPIIDKETNTTKWLIPNWLPSDKNSKGILFLDELNLSIPSIQASCYQLICDRRIGDYVLPDGWIIVSAGNRAEDRANIFELPSPLANRFSQHLELRIPSVYEWVKWGTTNGKSIDSRILAFLSFKQNVLFHFDRNSKDKAIATPRSWEKCSKLISDLTDKDLEFIERLVSGCVGESISVEFLAFLKLHKTIDLNEIIKNPEKVKEITELDLKYVVVSGISEIYRTKKSKELLDNIFSIATFLEPEFSVLLLRFIKGIDENYFNKNSVNSKIWGDLAKRLNKFF